MHQRRTAEAKDKTKQGLFGVRWMPLLSIVDLFFKDWQRFINWPRPPILMATGLIESHKRNIFSLRMGKTMVYKRQLLRYLPPQQVVQRQKEQS